MRWLNRAAAVLTGGIVTMSTLLILVLAGSASLWWRKQLPPMVGALGWTFSFGAGLAWPLIALTAAAMAALLALGAFRPGLQSPRRGSALLLGALALHAAWLTGIRPPAARTIVLTGLYVHGPLAFRHDFLIPCDDPAHPLPRGPELWIGPETSEVPLMAGIRLPQRGWHGSHPRNWPDSWSDVHGVQYWLVRVRGTLIGPGHYAWPPAQQYRLEVDSVLTVAPRGMFQDECGVDDPPAPG
jgi:hypothetical protein